MKRIFSLFVCLSISITSFGQDKTASTSATLEIPPGPTMKETEKWIKSELPTLGSYSIVRVKNDDRSNRFTEKYVVKSAILSDCRFSLSTTEEVIGTSGHLYTLTDIYTVTMKDVDTSTLVAFEEPVPDEYTYSGPSYFVSLRSIDRRQPFTSQRKQEGFPAGDTKPTGEVILRVGNKQAGNQAADVFRRAAVLCGAPNEPVRTGLADAPQETQTPASPTAPKMTNDDIIKLATAGLSEQVIITSIRQTSTKDFDLTPTGLIALKKAGVSDAVIVVMQEKGATVQPPSESEAKTPLPKYDATLAETKKPSTDNGCSGIELMGLYKDDWRPTMPLILWFAKVRNGTSLTRIVIVSWTNLYGEDKSFQAQVKPGDIATLELTRQQPVERQPINLRLSSCR